jgi:uncharacterized membrane protein YjjP (DUF1212 family)
MKKLNYVFMFAAMACGIGGMALAIYQGTNWVWQMSTAVWAYIAYLNQKHIDRNEVQLKELSDEIKEFVKNKKINNGKASTN